MDTPDGESPKILDQFGRPFPSRLKAPQHNSLVLSKTDGLPVPATSIDRRDFIKNLVVGFGGVAGLLCGTGSLYMDLKQDRREAERDRKSGRTVTKVLSGIFPFLFPFSRSVTRFHPNADNQNLLKMGIGYGNASPVAHLAGHEFPIDADVPLNLFRPPEKGLLAEKNDLDIYSHMTLLQAHEAVAALSDENLSQDALLGPQPFVRQEFDPSVPNVVIGSPTGNRLAAWFHGKYRRSEPGREREMIHEGILGLHLTYEFSLDADVDASIRKGESMYAWSIRRQTRPEGEIRSFVPKHKETCYFTVSVLPNFLSPGDYRGRHPVLLLEGCTALGTSGIARLWSEQALRPDGALTALERHVADRRSPYWQALFKVNGSEPRKNILGKTEEYASNIEFVEFDWIIPGDGLLLYSSLTRASMLDIANQLRNRPGPR